MRSPIPGYGLAGLVITAGTSAAIDLNVQSTDSILSASKTIVDKVVSIFNSSQIPGLLPKDDYYFWEAGLALDSLVNYWSLSGDDSLVPTVQQALLFQVGPDYDYMPPNQTKVLGNDDQATWGLAAMTAAERDFPAPANANTTWIQLAQNVFDAQMQRWDTKSCNGGLRWQIFSFNAGYNYKNSFSQGLFAELAARLYRYTGNSTYSDWAQKSVEWTQQVGLITEKYAVYDGTDVLQNCSEINHIQWTANAGSFIASAAYLTNATSDSFWPDLLWPLVATSASVFTGSSSSSSNSTTSSVLTEVACVPSGTCNTDQKAYLAILARALTRARDMTSEPANAAQYGGSGNFHDRISTILRASAQAAAASCSSSGDAGPCGGVGQDLSALELFVGNLPAAAEFTSKTSKGGSSGGKGSGGTAGSGGNGTDSSSDAGASTGGAAGLASSLGLVAVSALALVAAMS